MKISLRQPIRALSSFIEGKLIGLPDPDDLDSFHGRYTSWAGWIIAAPLDGIYLPDRLKE